MRPKAAGLCETVEGTEAARVEPPHNAGRRGEEHSDAQNPPGIGQWKPSAVCAVSSTPLRLEMAITVRFFLAEIAGRDDEPGRRTSSPNLPWVRPALR